MLLDLVMIFFLFFLSYALYVGVIIPAHRAIKKDNDNKLVALMKNLDK